MTSFSIILSKSIHFTENFVIIFFFKSEYYIYPALYIYHIYVHHIFITHSSIDEQLVWFQFFDIANEAAGVSCSNSLIDFSDWVRDKA